MIEDTACFILNTVLPYCSDLQDSSIPGPERGRRGTGAAPNAAAAAIVAMAVRLDPQSQSLGAREYVP